MYMVVGGETVLLKRFGARLALIRHSRGLTQAQLAEKVNMSIVAIAYLETGKRWARIGTLARLSEVLEVSLKELFEDL